MQKLWFCTSLDKESGFRSTYGVYLQYALGDPVYIGKKEAKDLPPTDDSIAEIGFKVTAIKMCASD